MNRGTFGVLIQLFLTLFLALPCFSAANTTPSPEFLIQTPSLLTNIDPYDLAVEYSGKNYRSDIFKEFSKDYLLAEILRDQANSKNFRSSSSLHIPLGPSLDFSDLESEIKAVKNISINLFKKYKTEMRGELKVALETSLTSLSEEDLKIFLSKKHEFLKDFGARLENIFRKFGLKPRYKFINAFLKSLNNTLYLQASTFIHSNTYGIPIYLTIGFGAAFGRIVYDLVIANTPLKKFINRDFGFYFLTAFGAAFSTTKIGTRTIRTLDLFIDTERFRRALTPVFEVFSGIGVGVHIESRYPVETAEGFTKMISANSYREANYVPVVGMLKVGDQDFSINHGFVATAPFYSLFLENTFSRKYLHIVYSDSANNNSFKNLIDSHIDSLKIKAVALILNTSGAKKAKLCRQLYYSKF